MQKQYTKIFFIFLLTLNSFFVKAQWVTIPDTNFVNWLNGNGFASCMIGNLMDTTCNVVDTSVSIDCSYKNIYSLDGIQYFDSLETLSCGGNHLTFLPKVPTVTLWCQYNQIVSLPSLPSTLTGLICYGNQLTSLPNLPPALQYLTCSSNQLTSLPALPSSLGQLECRNNSINTLPTLPSSLYWLDCGGNLLTSLPALPNSLNQLNCYNNLLTSLPNLPSSLSFLSCDDNQLTWLPVLPSGLFSLYCSSNQLSSLPFIIPPNLQTIYCSYNQLINLPPLSNLRNIYCDHNQITSLPLLPTFLTSLNCSHNLLTSLPDLPNYTFTELDCQSNFLSDIPELPDSMNVLYINDNLNITCLPKYKKINNFHWSNTGITCLPNAGYIGTAIPAINNLQLCQPASGCNYYWNIYGTTFHDGNSNCIKDISEVLIKNIPMKLDSGGNQVQIFVTNTEGYYSFQTGLGNYQIKIDTAGLPFDVTCPASGNYLSSLTVIDSLDADLDFGLQCKTGYLDLIAKSISPSQSLRPGAQRTLYLNAGDATLFYGVSCATGISGSVEAILNGPVSYFSPAAGALTPAAINGDTISWSVNDFSLINPIADFNIIIQVDSSATANDTVCVQLNIGSAASDNIPSNNSVSNCFPIVNSFDPNAKEIYPGGFVDTTVHDFTFTIYFQNTGNAAAENIYILDTLDTDLRLNTFQFLSSSHDAITQLLPGRILRFSFPHINLPDSISNEPASHGYVQFKMKRKNILYPDMIVLNHAQIYFDFNPPVTTNDAYAVLNFNCNDLFSVSIPDTAICENETFTAFNYINFPFPVNYDWLIDTTNVSATSSVSVTGLSAGVHQLTLNVSAGYCAVSKIQQIIVYPLPLQPAINISGDTLSTSAGFFYQWFFNSNSINGAVQNNYLISQSGWYSVMITDSNGCSALSDSVFVSPVGIADASTPLSMTITLYPNPVKDMLYIQTISKVDESLNIELSDITGRKLQTIFNGKTTSAFSIYSLSLKSFSKGVFILQVNSLVKRIVVE